MSDEAAARGFSLRVALLGLAFAVGVHIDGWAHNHDRVDQSFFTPWHAVLYGSYLAVSLFVVQRVIRARASGASWHASIPEGYALTLVGIGAFALAGVADMIWHMVFGVEQSLEALLSPTHLGLAAGAVLMATGPFVAGLRDPLPGWRGAAPAVLASAVVAAAVSFMTQFSQPLSRLWPTREWGVYSVDDQLGAALGVAGFLWWAAVLSAVMLLLAHSDRLPRGAVFVVVGLAAMFAASQGDDGRLALPALAGALVVEVIRPILPEGRLGFRALALLMPLVVTAAHFLALSAWYEVTWPVELWSGTIVGTGLVGAMVSLLLWPPGRDIA